MRSTASALSSAGEYTYFAGRALWAAVLSVARPGPVLRQLHSIVVGALPLAIVAGIALGAVIWMHTHAVLARTGTVDYLPTVLAAAVLLELAPIAAGLIVAARTGSALGAELGSMRIGEQIDALEMLGIPPLRTLVGPRVLACMIALPIVHLCIASLAIFSGFVAENIVGSTNWLKYQSASLKELFPREVIPAALKTVVFGYLIGASGCYRGLRAEGGTEGVGRAATSAVVMACLLVLAADVLLVGLIQILIG
jgi:phospholipid/cholesterol/gamma-HCH transport system permease protein